MTLKLRTPYFLINKCALDDELSKLKAALYNAWPNYIIGYSYKTNALPWVIEYFKNNGCYAEVVSDDEYELARSIGVESNHLIYNGIAKSKESFIEAIRNRAVVNIDAEYEIDWLDEISSQNLEQIDQFGVGIRVNFDLESLCPGQTQCGEDGERFGFCYENGELKRAINRIEAKGFRIAGLHLHKSSKTRMPDIYRAIAEMAVEISQSYCLNLDYIDIGGGFFGGLETKPQFSEYFNMISSILQKQFNPEITTLIVEPGMALIGAPVDYVTTVVDVKKTTRNTFVVTHYPTGSSIVTLMSNIYDEAYFSKNPSLDMQLRLIELGYLDNIESNTDGQYGPTLTAAIAQVQVSMNLPYEEIDGKADAEFQNFLFSDNALAVKIIR